MLLINRDQIQGRLMTARGLMKRALGWASLNTLMQADGELDRMAGEPVDLVVNDKVIARGEVVVIEENFGIRVTQRGFGKDWRYPITNRYRDPY